MDILARRRRRRAEVNIVPLVDVLTVLIFFFLLTMQFKSIYAVDITPPKMDSSSAQSRARPAVISVTKDGRYFFGDKAVTLAQLKSEIEAFSGSPDASVVLLADQEAMLQYATNVIDLIKLSKIRKLSLQTLGK